MHNERGQEVHEKLYYNDFPKKHLLQGDWAVFGPKMKHSHNSGAVFQTLQNERVQGIGEKLC